MMHFGIFLVVAVLFLIYIFNVKKAFKKCTQTVTATYLGVGPGLGKSFGHTLLFSYDYNGEHYESVESMTSQNLFTFNRDKMNRKMEKLGYVIGQEYEVRINPDEPKAMIADTKSTYRSLNLLVIVLVVVTVLELMRL